MARITAKSVVSNTAWTSAAHLISQAATFFVLPAFISELGPELYGVWAISAALTGYLGVLDLGFAQGLLRFLTEAREKKDWERLERITATGLLLLLSAGLVSALVFIGLASPIVAYFRVPAEHVSAAEDILRICGLAAVPTWCTRIYSLKLNAAFRLKELKAARLVSSLTESGLMIGLLYGGVSVVPLRAITLGSSVLLGLVIQRHLSQRAFPEARVGLRHASIAEFRKIGSFSVGVFLTTVLQMIGRRLDAVIVGRALGVGMLPFYVAANKLWMVVMQYAGLLNNAFMPAVYNLRASGDKKRLEELIERTTRYRSLVVLPGCLLGAIGAPYLIPLWLGPEFEQSVVWAQVYMLAPPIGLFGQAQAASVAFGFHKQRVTIVLMSTILNVLLSIALIEPFGIGGPILGTVLAQALFGPAVFVRLFSRLIGVRAMPAVKQVFKHLLATAAAGAVVYPLSLWWAPSTWLSLVAFGLVAGLLVMTMVGGLTFQPGDKKTLGHLLEATRLLRLMPSGVRQWLR